MTGRVPPDAPAQENKKARKQQNKNRDWFVVIE